MKPEWLVEFPPYLLRSMLDAMNRPLDESIKPDRDCYFLPHIPDNQFSEIAVLLQTSLSSIAQEQMTESWASLAPLREFRYRFKRNLGIFRDALTRGTRDFITNAASAPMRPTTVFEQSSLETSTEFDLQFFKKARAPTLSSTHPNNPWGASPQVLITLIGDVLDDHTTMWYAAKSGPHEAPFLPIEAVEVMKEILDKLKTELNDERFSEPFRLAAISLFELRKAHGLLERFTAHSTTPRRLLEWLHACFAILASAFGHFEELFDTFDNLDAVSRSDWLLEGPTQLERDSRLFLAPYLKDGRSAGPDTTTVLSIAKLYQSIFQTAFRINARETIKYQKEVSQAEQSDTTDGAQRTDRSYGILQYEVNQSLKFACAVIRTFELERVMFPFDLSEIRLAAGKPARDNPPTPYDSKRHQRSFGLEGGRHLVSDFELINKIGDIWKRQRPKIAHGRATLIMPDLAR